MMVAIRLLDTAPVLRPLMSYTGVHRKGERYVCRNAITDEICTEDPEAPTLNRFTPATHSTGFKATDRAKTKGIHTNTSTSRYLISVWL